MATLVCFHAHPDDEAIVTGGTMARAAAAGHRVVLVVATCGELGEHPRTGLAPGETLAQRRVAETHAAAAILGVHRVEFLGYHDSGMAGEASNGAAGAFAVTDVEEAAARLAAILSAERAAVLTVYDEHGGYGHPDHVQVHRVGIRAADLAGVATVLEATINRDHLRRLLVANAATLSAVPEEDRPSLDEIDSLGVTEDRITTTVAVDGYVERKRAAMAAHASQIDDQSFFMAMPDDAFAMTFGTEWFIHRGAPPGTRDDDFFAHLDAPR